MSSLIIELKGYGFRFFLDDNPHESYFIKDNTGSFVFVVELDREGKEFIDEKYEDMGVKDLKHLFCELVTKPNETLKLLGIDAKVDKVVIEYS